MSKFPLLIATVLLFAIFTILTTLVGYWKFYPINPADFDEAGIVVTTPKVKAGGDFNYIVPVKKYGVYPAAISSTLLLRDNSRAYAMLPVTGALPQGEYRLNVEVQIPKRVDPGIYRLCRIYSYDVTPTTTVVKSYITPEFEVLEADK